MPHVIEDVRIIDGVHTVGSSYNKVGQPLVRLVVRFCAEHWWGLKTLYFATLDLLYPLSWPNSRIINRTWIWKSIGTGFPPSSSFHTGLTSRMLTAASLFIEATMGLHKS